MLAHVVTRLANPESHGKRAKSNDSSQEFVGRPLEISEVLLKVQEMQNMFINEFMPSNFYSQVLDQNSLLRVLKYGELNGILKLE